MTPTEQDNDLQFCKIRGNPNGKCYETASEQDKEISTKPQM